MKKIFISITVIVLIFTTVTSSNANREDIKIYGANWTPGFFEVASSITFNGKSIYISDVNNSRIQVYSGTFKPLFWFGGYGEGRGAFTEITGISSKGERIYVTSVDSHSEKRGRIQSFSEDGILKAVFEVPKERSDFLKASEISNENIIAITEETFYIFSNAGKLLKEFSQIEGEVFLAIRDLAVIPPYGFAFIDKNKRGFFTVNNEMNEIRSYGEEYVYLPSAITYGNEQFFIADSGGKIYIFDKSGKFIKSLNTNIYIQSIEVLDNTTLIMASLLKKDLLTLNTETSEIKAFKIEPKSELELHWPTAICLDKDDLIYVSDDYTGGVKLISAKNGNLAGRSGITEEEALKVIGVSATTKNAIYILSRSDLSTVYKFKGEKFEKKLNIDGEISFISIKTDYAGNLYALDGISNSIFKFSDDNLVRDFRISQKEKIFGLYIKEELYIASEGGKIISFDTKSGDMKLNMQLKNIPEGLNDFHHFAVSNDHIIFSSRFDHKLYAFSLKDGSFIGEIGGIGGPKTFSPQSNIQVDITFEPSKFLFPEEIFYKEELIYISDSGNHRVQAISESYFTTKEIIIELKIGSKKAKIDGKEFNLDVAPFIENKRTFVPVRFIAEEFGADVTWNDRERKVTIKEKETTIELWIDRKRALINKKEYTLDVSPKIVNKRTFVPVRFIAEGFGADVTWNDKNQTVVIRRRS